MTDAFAAALNDLDEEAFQLLYGRWDPLEPAQVADLFTGASLQWYVAGGRAARIGAPPRHHDDTDIAVRADDLGQLRLALAGWHLWEADSGSLRPLLPGIAITGGCQQLWARRNAREPWQIDLLLDRNAGTRIYRSKGHGGDVNPAKRLEARATYVPHAKALGGKSRSPTGIRPPSTWPAATAGQPLG